jgi:16S rRNA (uracil1498-N3)-methyltransferase
MRVLIERGSGEAGKRVRLDDNEVHHLRVRRARPQEVVEVLDGAGLRGEGQLVQAGREWLVDISTAQLRQRPPALTLAVAAGDRERFTWMVEKAVELGVTGIVPLETSRTANVATRLKDAHLARLRRAVLDSIKQCGVAWAPSVEDAIRLDKFLQSTRPGSNWLADSEGGPAPTDLADTPVTVVVGPEGGFTEGELEALKGAGFLPIMLGPHTLRFETAALAAAAIVAQARLRGRHG